MPAGAGWLSWDIMGGNATNPLTLNWGDDVNLIGVVTAGTSTEIDYDISTNLPYVEITYTVNDIVKKIIIKLQAVNRASNY